jgi:hypothetical protein
MTHLDGEFHFVVASGVNLAVDHGKSYCHLRGVCLRQRLDVACRGAILIGARIVKHDFEIIGNGRLHGCSVWTRSRAV